MKQDSRAWFDTFKSTLLSLGFASSKVDSSLFIFNTSEVHVFLLVYVNDIIITGSDEFVVKKLVCQLNSNFKLKGLEDLNFFLAIEVLPQLAGRLFL